jgi:hypothetical protein
VNPYDIRQIMVDMETNLIDSYYRNMSRHAEQELFEGFEWPMWQQKKLLDLQQYQKESRRIIDKTSKVVKDAISGLIIDSYADGANVVEALLKGFKKQVVDEDFGVINRRKLDAMVDAINNDMDKAFSAALRLQDDAYRQIVYKAQFMYAAGATTLPKAIDMAASDFLQNGINCIQYRDGKRVNIASYTEMAVRTSAKRAYLTGEGAKAAEWGEYLVQVTSYGACSETCLPWQGKVYVDDVYAGGKPDGVHDLLSTAMSNGLYHPNCRHTHGPYFEDISYRPTAQDPEVTQYNYAAEQKQRYIERKIRQWKRTVSGSVDGENVLKAEKKVKEWQKVMRQHMADYPFLSRKYYREKG